MNDKFRKVDVKEAADFILDSDNVLILGHTNPDGDAVGSATALREIFSSLGKRAAALVPTRIPDYVSFLSENEDLLYKGGEENYFEKIITVDVSSASQLGRLSHLADRVDLMIDHHSNGEAFADNLTVPGASAAGETVFDIYEELIARGAISENADICRRIFAAITSDTGSFKYSNTTPMTFRIAASLSETINGCGDGGLYTWDISRLIHDTFSEKDLKVNAFAANGIKLYAGGALAVCISTAEDMKALGVEEKDMGGVIDVVRSLEGVDVAVALRQSAEDPKKYKLSSRANSPVDVAALCEKFGGGGHVRAAGATVFADSPEEALSKTVPVFETAVEKFRGGSRSSGS